MHIILIIYVQLTKLILCILHCMVSTEFYENSIFENCLLNLYTYVYTAYADGGHYFSLYGVNSHLAVVSHFALSMLLKQ